MNKEIYIVFYSMYGHVHKLAEAIGEGAREVAGCNVSLFRVPELVPDAVLEKSGAKEAQSKFAHIPVITVDQLAKPDAIIFGTPTRFGNMCGQMRNFLDQTGGLWAKDAFVNKIGSVFTSTATQHGGQETTLTSFHTTLFHLGMIVVGVPYSEKRQMETQTISGGSPYGSSTIAGSDGKRHPTENELSIARYQGKHVAIITTAFNLKSNKM